MISTTIVSFLHYTKLSLSYTAILITHSTQSNITILPNRTKSNVISSKSSPKQNVLQLDAANNRITFIPEISEKCKRQGICEDIPNYPEEYVELIMKQAVWLNRTKHPVRILQPQFEQRIRPPEEYIELCNSNKRFISPRAARDINNHWHFILNKVKGPQQNFEVDICMNQNLPCSSVIRFAIGYQGRCQQKFALRTMTGIDKFGNLVEKPFRIPNCCSCIYKVVTK